MVLLNIKLYKVMLVCVVYYCRCVAGVCFPRSTSLIFLCFQHSAHERRRCAQLQTVSENINVSCQFSFG